MAVEYKLTYFDGRGLADVSRQLFALANVKFEDIRVSHETWATIKNDAPFGQLPVLETKTGLKIPQSLAIARYLANKFGFSGKTEEEKALTDAFADQFKDFYVEIKTYYYSKLGFMNHDPEEEKTKVLIPARDKFFKILLKYLKHSKSGYLVDSGVTFADLIICDNMRTLLKWWPEYTKEYPEIQEWYNKVDNIPAIRQHIQNSNDTGF
ncbi:unnamed protein product [Caenorhabditis angaria]|uniref:glutathione transferase n=1 Tax=Caenorhabditis angaria TaxID=860376 RepID=A0A9P1IAU9_9PELO|nr:unnamed protein product [Caenorhabditis angaria]